MSDLERAIARARREIATAETPIRRRLWRAYRDALAALNADLDAVTAMIGEARRAGIDVSPDWLRRQARYRMLMLDAEREFARFAETGARILAEGQAAAVSGGAHAAPELIQAAGVPASAVTSFGARVNVPAVERLVSALQPGSPVRTVLDAYGPHAAKVIEDELVAGIIEGKGPREIVRTIRRGVNSGTNQARLEALVRTEMMRSFRGSLFDQYAALGVEEWRWTAALGMRTCLACISMSGRTFPMSKPFMASHVRCRCVPTPVAEGVEPETGEAWLARQDEATQRLMLGTQGRYDLYRQGVPIDSMVGVKRSKLWGDSVYVKPAGMVDVPSAPVRYTTKPKGNDARDSMSGMNIRPRDPDAKNTLKESKAGIDAIRSVHGMPEDTPGVAFQMFHSTKAEGMYSRVPQNMRTPTGGWARDADGNILQGYMPHNIAIENRALDARSAVIHEYGHYLDDQVLGRAYNSYNGAVLDWGTSTEAAPIQRWRNAVHQSDTYKTLQASPNTGETMWIEGREYTSREYLMMDSEMWARSYQQYVTKKTQDPELLRILEEDRKYKSGWQWSDEEFEPIERAIDDIFADLGMIEKVT